MDKKLTRNLGDREERKLRKKCEDQARDIAFGLNREPDTLELLRECASFAGGEMEFDTSSLFEEEQPTGGGDANEDSISEPRQDALIAEEMAALEVEQVKPQKMPLPFGLSSKAHKDQLKVDAEDWRELDDEINRLFQDFSQRDAAQQAAVEAMVDAEADAMLNGGSGFGVSSRARTPGQSLGQETPRGGQYVSLQARSAAGVAVRELV